MKKILRKEAVAQGLSTYYTGKECIHGHLSKRRTVSGQCLECNKQISRKQQSKIKIALQTAKEKYNKTLLLDIPECPVEQVSNFTLHHKHKELDLNGFDILMLFTLAGFARRQAVSRFKASFAELIEPLCSSATSREIRLLEKSVGKLISAKLIIELEKDCYKWNVPPLPRPFLEEDFRRGDFN